MKTITLLVAAGTVGLTAFLFLIIPEGLLPDSGYGRDSWPFRCAAGCFIPRDVETGSRRWDA